MRPDRPPTDPDVDLHVPGQRAELRQGTASLLGAVAAGGVIGGLARHGLTVAFPHSPHGFPWATFAVNVSGCLLIGVLMVLVTEVWRAHRLVRPFLGTGLLGGYTTFSTYAVQVQQAVAVGAARTGLLYLAGTLVAALAAVWAGMTLTRLATGRRRPWSHRPGNAGATR
ncbi:fluoride efflux transporter FluC [Micromonospora sp. CA-263727]|uniref:fluoride efflux transporter FluC n=1 Tax=Micromonospora sp. CA-263727 TaxID=3239967 RepID=UPI003D8DF5D6